MKIAFALFSLCLLSACEYDDGPAYSRYHRTVYTEDRPAVQGGYYYQRSRYYRDSDPYYDYGPVYRVESRRYYDDRPRSRVIIGY